MLSRTLFIIGPVGENDIHMPLLQGTTVHQIKTIIYPAIIQSVVSAIEVIKVHFFVSLFVYFNEAFFSFVLYMYIHIFLLLYVIIDVN